MALHSVIYFSYAWRDKNETGESREKIVDELYKSLKEDGYNVVRDKVDLGYKGVISNFMRDIGKGELIVVVISDKYLKSPNCMYELLEIFRASNSNLTQMREKIFPIVLQDAKIYDSIDRLDYVEYWKNKKEELDKKISKVGLEYSVDVIDDFKIYREITSNIGLLSSLLKDLNTLDLKELAQDNFFKIKIEITVKAETLGTDVPHPTAKRDDPSPLYHLVKIRKFLERVLTDPELNSLCMDYFDPVYNNFADGMNKLGKINLLLSYCKRNDKMKDLLQAMKEANEDQFEKNEPYYSQ